MKVFKYLVILVTAISVLGSLFKDVKGFLKGFGVEIGEEVVVEKTQPVLEEKEDMFSLEGVYECSHIENSRIKSYLEFKEDHVYYYGNTLDIDYSYNTDSIGYFFIEASDIMIDEEMLSFRIAIKNDIMYSKPISPLYRTNNNALLKGEIFKNSPIIKNYKGVLKDEWILLFLDNMKELKFTRIEK